MTLSGRAHPSAAEAPAPWLHMGGGSRVRLTRAIQPVGRLVDIRIPRDAFPPGASRLSMAACLRLLGAPVPRADERLPAIARIFDEAIARAGLPPIAVTLSSPAEPMPGVSDRLDLVLAILSKTSGNVFVASAEPVLARLQRWRLTLVLPVTWSAKP